MFVMLYLNEFEFWRHFNWDTVYACELIWCAHEIVMSSRNSHTISSILIMNEPFDAVSWATEEHCSK